MQSENEYIYLDYAATSPLIAEVQDAMAPFMQAGRDSLAGMNPNALSLPGRDAFKALEGARRDVASAIGAHRPDEVVFTSGATEADNAAIAGMAKAAYDARVRERGAKAFGDGMPEVIVSAIEHDAVLNPAKRLEREGYKVVVLPPDGDGFVEVSTLQDAITPNTLLVSVQMANSEIGSIQPVKQLADMAHRSGAAFHTDATQALGKIPIDMEELNVDAASFSSHKIGGPKGVGALYLRNRTPFHSQMLGGGQEASKRSGTQNVAGAIGFAAACKSAVCLREEESERLRVLRDKLYRDMPAFDSIQQTVDVTEGSLDYLPNIANFCVAGIESETAVLRFDLLGFAVSGGSACASRSLEPSHVLTTIGIPSDIALGEIRISMGRFTTKEDIDALLHAVPKVLNWGSL